MSEIRKVYGVDVGDRVEHIRDSSWTGEVVELDDNMRDRGVTTCRVQWDDLPAGETDVQWTNKLIRVA